MNKKTVLITGSSGGIGQAIAHQLAADGFDLVLHFNSSQQRAEQLKTTVEKQGITARILGFDVSNRDQSATKINQDIEQHGAYYGVVCNAGIIRDTAFPAMSGEQWDSVLRTNLDSFYNVLNPLLMPMVRNKQGGRIVTMSSVSGIMGNRGQTNYSAAKGGLIAASKSLAIELAKRKITVNCVAPGIIDTEMTEQIDSNILKNLVPLRRAGTAQEVASLVAYLFSDSAAYITRQVISVNGGMC